MNKQMNIWFGSASLCRNDFEIFKKDIEQAKRKNDEKKLLYTYGKVKKDYLLKRKVMSDFCVFVLNLNFIFLRNNALFWLFWGQNRKQMYEEFQLLHEELMTIKNRCKEYAEKVGQGWNVIYSHV